MTSLQELCASSPAVYCISDCWVGDRSINAPPTTAYMLPGDKYVLINDGAVYSVYRRPEEHSKPKVWPCVFTSTLFDAVEMYLILHNVNVVRLQL